MGKDTLQQNVENVKGLVGLERDAGWQRELPLRERDHEHH